jgi:hypothetical protein
VLPAVLVAALRSDLDLRRTFPNLSPGLEQILTLGQEGAAGYLALLLVCVGLALLGGCCCSPRSVSGARWCAARRSCWCSR